MKKRILTFITALSLGLSMTTPFNKVNAQEKDMRAAWISTVHNIDFPKTKNNVTAQKNEFTSMLDKLQDMGMNTVVVQVRPKGDALYKSKINPWSDVLTGTQGKDPGYDPLEFMVAEAHKRGMELHAWLNPYRVTTSGTSVNNLATNHPARKNPSMVFEYNGALYYDPASNVVQQHIADTVKEIVQNYKVDAIHFDDYFYPDKYPLPVGEDRDGKVANQRRQNVNDMVSLVSKTIKQVNSKVKFGISPVGIWKNNYPDKTGSNTKGNESYYAVYADTRTWIRNGWIDYVVPQIYWEIGHSAADYKTLVEWWSNEVKGTNVDLYIGQGVYKNEVAKEITTQLTLNKKYPEIKGSMFFTTRDLVSNLEGSASAIKKFYANNPNVPEIEEPESNGSNAEIITYDVNLRTKADFSSDIIYTIKVGTKVELLSVEGDFAKVKYNGKTGYVMAKYVKKLSSAPETPNKPDDKPVVKPEPEEPSKPEKPEDEKPVATKTGTVVNATVLNVRSGAGTSYSVVTKINKGDKITILDTKSGWHKIKTANGKTGWVSGDYIKISTSQTEKPSNPGTSAEEKGKVVNATVLNVRSGAGTSYSVVTKINKGDTVEIVDKKSGWYKIKVSNGKTGWVSGDYIKIITTSSDKPSSPNSSKTKTVTANTLNVRSGAGTKYSIVTKLRKGNKVTVTETKNGWSKIKTSNNKTGWVSVDYIN